MRHPDWIQSWKIKKAWGLSEKEMTVLLWDAGQRLDVPGVWLGLVSAGKATPEGGAYPLLNFRCAFPHGYARRDDTGLLLLRVRLFVELRRVAAFFTQEEIAGWFTEALLPAVYEGTETAAHAAHVDALARSLFTTHPETYSPAYSIVGGDLFPRADLTFFDTVFTDSILMHTASAVHSVHRLGHRRREQVSGLSRATVAAILASPAPTDPLPSAAPYERVCADTAQAYEEGAEAQTKGKRKQLLCALYLAMGGRREDVARKLGMSMKPKDSGRVNAYAGKGRALARTLGLPPLPGK